MSAEVNRSTVRAAIAQALGLKEADLPAGANTDNVEQWDSLGHLEVMETLSTTFGLDIGHAEAVTLLSEDSILSALEKAIRAGSAN